MRLTLAAAAVLALAAPAHAQRVDTRVDNVSESPDGFACTAHALPDLRITHDWRGGERGAAWTSQARDVGTTDELHLNVTFSPNNDAPFGTDSRVMGFLLIPATNPLARPAAVAHLRVDGTPDPTVLAVEGDAAALSVAVNERQRGTLAERLMRAAILEVDLVDATGAPLRRYSWDVRKLRRAPELLQLINWSCR